MVNIQQKYKNEIEELVEASVRLGELGYVTSHGGNLSYRVGNDVVLITPTKVSKRKMTFEDITIINLEGQLIFAANGRKPTGEVPIHLGLFKKRPDIKGLIHAHPPVITGFALSDETILTRPFLPEPIIEVGPILPVEYAEPLSNELAATFEPVIDKSNAFLMKNHGVMICSCDGVGRTLELLEMMEATAYSLFIAATIGKARELPVKDIKNLERTMKTRGLAFPGTPGVVKSLEDMYFTGGEEKHQ